MAGYIDFAPIDGQSPKLVSGRHLFRLKEEW